MGHLLDALLVDVAARVKKSEIAQSTADDYTKCIVSRRKAWGEVRVEDVDAPALYRWQEARAAPVRTNRERTLHLEAFELGVKRGLVRDNPFASSRPTRSGRAIVT